jgi:hypothetical protein
LEEFNFAIVLFSIVVGLGVADIANSVHRLLTAGVKVRWAALPLASSAYIGLVLVMMWYELWSLRRLPAALGFWPLVSLLIELVLIYLAAAGSLPDDPEKEPDLAAFYWRRSRLTWTLMLLFAISYLGHTLYFVAISSHRGMDVWAWAWRLIPLLVFLTMAGSKNRWVHGAGLAVLVGLAVQRTAGWIL